ncbi:hypothetical protein [Arsenophonus nasoniae]|uniref:hypothetical protein n=1 Tax=Arsenophonus nasoniae TaxID=638 RepID=UPI0038790C22
MGTKKHKISFQISEPELKALQKQVQEMKLTLGMHFDISISTLVRMAIEARKLNWEENGYSINDPIILKSIVDKYEMELICHGNQEKKTTINSRITKTERDFIEQQAMKVRHKTGLNYPIASFVRYCLVGDVKRIMKEM